MKSPACAWFNIKFRFRMKIIFYHLKFDVTSVLLLSRTGNSYDQCCQTTDGQPNVQCPRGFNHICEVDERECSHYLKQVTPTIWDMITLRMVLKLKSKILKRPQLEILKM